MGAHANFDPVNKLITLTTAPVNGVVTLDVLIDLYSDAKEDWLADPVLLRKFNIPFRVIGGDPLGGNITAGAYFFLRNDLGWRIRPYESDQELTITGNLYPQDTALPIFVPTIGNFTASVRLSTSSLTQAVSSADTASAVRIELAPELANMDATVSSRATQASVDAIAATLATTPDDVWEILVTGTFPAGSTGEKLQQLLTTGNFLALK